MNIRVTGISSMATRQFLVEAVQAWRQQSGIDVTLESVGGVDAAKRVDAGEAFDFVVLAADAIAKLADTGRVVSASRVDLARSGVAIAVRQGAARPPIHSEEALREAVLAARTVGYSTGPSGVALQRLFARWDLADALTSRLVQAPPGVPVGTLIARGQVEIGFQQLGELMHLEGIVVLGPMPPGLEIITIFSGAVCATATAPDAARALLEYVGSPAADPSRRQNGMERA